MYSKLEEKVLEYCNQHKMLGNGTVLVALSGGGDSVALLNILVRIGCDLGLKIEAAHLNHSLRGEEADKDENFCREICSNMKIPLTVERLKADKIVNNPNSIETAAREARLGFLKRVSEKINAGKIATGHTLDDLSETVLQRIIRGTGPYGLSGILPVRERLWIRPLLCLTRKEIRDYLSENDLKFCEDITNQDTVFFRNRIRHELIPFLRKNYSPNITSVIARLAELSRIQEEYVNEKIMEAYSECVIHEDAFKILLDKSKLMDYNKLLQQRILRHCLRVIEGAGRDTDMDEIESILKILSDSLKTIDVSLKVRCGVNKKFIVFTLNLNPFNPKPMKLSGETKIPMGGGGIFGKIASEIIETDGKNCIIVDQDIIKKFGILTVGSVKTGDEIKPFGENRTLKVRNIFSSVSIPDVLRDSIPVVRAGALPIWIPGLKSSEYIKLNSDKGSNKFIVFTYRKGINWC